MAASDSSATTIDPEMLLHAYAAGVFPMADGRDDAEVYWVEPVDRAILPLDGLHVSRSLKKALLSERFTHTADAAFGDVVRLCAESAPDRPSTWINAAIEDAVNRLHAAGHAHSIETWHEGELVGGLYGVSLGGAFFGESMFSRTTDASKLALVHLVARLRAGGYTLLDCQFMTPHLASLGAIELPQSAYLERLRAAIAPPNHSVFSSLAWPVSLSPAADPVSTTVLGPVSGWCIWQSLTQTS